MIENLNVPTSFRKFVAENRCLIIPSQSDKPELLPIFSIDDLILIQIQVNSDETDFEFCFPPDEDDTYVYEPESWDPNDLGFYEVDAIPLVKPSDPEDPFGSRLVWYPGYSEFGQWDSEHRNALRFGVDVTWEHIVDDPSRFVNNCWNDDEDFLWVTPWLDSSFDYFLDPIYEGQPQNEDPPKLRPRPDGSVSCPNCRQCLAMTSTTVTCRCGQEMKLLT